MSLPSLSLLTISPGGNLIEKPTFPAGDFSSNILIHLHIPKTAGTALRESFKRALPKHAILEWYPANPFDLPACVSEFDQVLRQNPDVRFISGHFLYGIHKVIKARPYKYITVLRDPISRILSQLNHDIHHNLPFIKRENVDKLLQSKTVIDYIRDKQIGYHYNNVQARYISGIAAANFDGMSEKDIVDRCISNVEADFLFACSQKDLKENLGNLFLRLGLQPDSLREENTRSRVDPQKVLSTRDLGELAILNRLDNGIMARLCPEASVLDGKGCPRHAENYSEMLLHSYKIAISNLLNDRKKLQSMITAKKTI